MRKINRGKNGIKNITLRVNSELYDKYRELCKKKGLLVSRQVEIMMEQQIKEGRN
jgi:antitoxin component of RelBE/YafQ-DinJ toxin-antitoxin module